MQEFSQSSGLSTIKSAIQDGNQTLARQLLRTQIQQNPSADAWYLASLVCTSREQQINALERALSFDPFHDKANKALRQTKEFSNASNLYEKSKLAPTKTKEKNSKLIQEVALIFTQHDWDIKMQMDNVIQVEKKKPVNAFLAALLIFFLGFLGSLLVCAAISSSKKKIITLEANSDNTIHVTDEKGRKINITNPRDVMPTIKKYESRVSYGSALGVGLLISIVYYICILSSQPTYY